MQDEFTGQAGTFITDPDTGTRIPLEEWAAKQTPAQAEPTPKPSKTTKEESV
jgi:hypothetical protein